MRIHASLRSGARARAVYSFTTFVCCTVFLSSYAGAQYSTTYLVSNVPGAVRQDSSLVDGWGLAAFPGSPFWVSNQNTSTSTLYKGGTTIVPLVVQIPCVSAGVATVPCPVPGLFPLTPPFGPTGIVANTFAQTGAFTVTQGNASAPALFIFNTLDGLIAGWNPKVNATQAIATITPAGGIYTGLAIWGSTNGAHLYAANAAGGIDVFDSTFTMVASFAADSNPGPFTPYGIQTIGNTLYVTYSSPATPGGIVDACDLTTSDTMPACHRLAASTSSPFTLNGPWGLALAPGNFGPLSNDLLVGNLESGQIAAFDPMSGTFQGMLTLKDGKPFSIVGLWALQFGMGSPNNGPTNQLFFTAGPAAKEMPIFSNGLFGVVTPPIASSAK